MRGRAEEGGGELILEPRNDWLFVSQRHGMGPLVHPYHTHTHARTLACMHACAHTYMYVHTVQTQIAVSLAVTFSKKKSFRLFLPRNVGYNGASIRSK